MPLFHAVLYHFVVLLLRSHPDEPFPRPRFFDRLPTYKEIKDNTHYYIIGGQHTVKAHRVLIQEGNLFH